MAATYIDPSQVRPKFTSSIIANYQASNSPTSLLQSKFKGVAKDTLYLEWNVRRIGETVASDALRGATPNVNQISKLTHKVEQPPYFYEAINVTGLMGYDRAFPDNGMIDASAFNDFRETVRANMKEVQYKIDRRRELMCKEIYTTGKVTMPINGETDYLRKSASMPGYSAAWDWTIPTVDPRTIIASGCSFIRAYGQSEDAIFDMYVAEDAYQALINNPFIVDAEKFHVNTLTEDVARDANGAVLMRVLTAGAYKVRIFTYPQVYTPVGTTDLTGAAKVPYLTTGQIIITPANPMFITGYARVPTLPAEVTAQFGTGGIIGNIDKKYYIGQYFDIPRRAWYITIEAAFLPVPIAVDQIFNAQVIAS